VSEVRARFETDPACLAALAPEWDALLDAAGDALASDTPAWHAAWRDVFSTPGAAGVLCFRDAGELVGMLPLARSRGRRGPRLVIREDLAPGDALWLDPPPRLAWLPVRQLAPAACLESANLRGRLIARPERRADCFRALPDGLAALGGWDLTLLCVDARQVAELEAGFAGAPLPLLIRPGWSASQELALAPWDEYARGRSRQFRKRMKGAWARAEALPALKVETLSGPAALAGLDALVGVAASSWKGVGHAARRGVLPITPHTQSFFARLCEAPGVEPLVVVIADGTRPLAAMLVLRRGDALLGCLTCYAEDAAALSPGRLLMQRTCEWGFARGARRFDLNGDTQLNAYFGERRIEYALALVFGTSAWSRLLHAAARRLPVIAPRAATAAAEPEP
jgi:hypothetical protein